ncbi:hypothetical protein EDB87DRAFT_952047 [Lactarius vividus]|nr:hypothetical protein EDB87DRAFT_952047 [Lactarius vividus]
MRGTGWIGIISYRTRLSTTLTTVLSEVLVCATRVNDLQRIHCDIWNHVPRSGVSSLHPVTPCAQCIAFPR